MKLKELSKEELENMAYDDIAFLILSETKKSQKIIDLFNEIGNLVNLPSNVIEEKIGDFFEMLNLDKRFIMLDDGTWDLSSRHAKKLVIEDDDDDLALDEDDEEENIEEDEEEEIFYDDQDDEDTDDDLKDLVIIDEEDEEGTNI